MANEGCSDMLCTGLYPYFFHNDAERAANLAEWTASLPAWKANMDTTFKSIFKIMESNVTGLTEDPAVTARDLDPRTVSGGVIFKEINEPFVYAFRTADGAFIWIKSGNCWTVPASTSKYSGHCGWVMVDVNGKKAPNRYGRDIYSMYSTVEGPLVMDYGMDYAKFAAGDSWETSDKYWKNNNTCVIPSTSGENGAGCGARLLEEGWKLNY